jgi:hypothetical protein
MVSVVGLLVTTFARRLSDLRASGETRCQTFSRDW